MATFHHSETVCPHLSNGLLQGTRLDCILQDHRLAGKQKNLKAEYTPKPNIHQGRITSMEGSLVIIRAY